MKRVFTVFLTMLFAGTLLMAQGPKVILITPDDRDDAQYEFLMRNGFDVEKFFPGSSLAAAGQDTIDKLNAADLIIVGRSPSSSEFDNEDKPVWNDLTAPLIINSQWVARENRVGMIKSRSAWHKNSEYPVAYANVLLPTDPIFADVTLDGDSLAWMLVPHDFVGGLDSVTNGTIVAGSNLEGAPHIIRWDAGTQYYPGSEDTCAGPRVYFGFGNDDIGPGRGVDETVNFFPLTRAGKTVYLAEICRLMGIPAQQPVFGAEDVRVMMYTDYEADIDEYGQFDDIEQTNWLVNQGFYVTKFWAGAELGDAGQDTLDKINMSVDLVIAGRSNNSGGFDGISKPVWNGLTVPLIINSQYAAREQRVGMIKSRSAYHRNTEYAMAYANVMMPADPVFTGVELVGDSVGWTLAPHDFIGGLDSATNGTILAGSNLERAPLIVRWDGGTEYYPGAGDEAIPAGPRYYFGFGNDNLRDNGENRWPNDFNLTPPAKQAYLNAICLMAGLETAQLPTAVSTPADAVVTFVTDYEDDEANEGYRDDQIQIDWLMKNGVHVNVFYPGSAISAASQDTLDILNASELIIVGRSNNSGNFDGDDQPVWNSLAAPLIINSQYVARENRIGMIKSRSAFHRNTEYELAYANFVDTDNPVLDNVTLAGDSVAWTMMPHDFVGGLDSVTNGTIHAGSNLERAPLIVTWDGGAEYYPGAGVNATPAGPRAFVAIGNDNLRDNGVNYRPNDFNLTEDGQQIYMNVISLMLGAEMASVMTVSSNADLDSLTFVAEGATMTPEFDTDSMEYELMLPEGVTEVELSAYPNDILAFTIGDSAIMDIMDTLEIEVHVIAENWNEKIYTVTIIPDLGGVGVEDKISSSSTVKLYPNPTSGILNVESNMEMSRITIYNVVGKAVMDLSNLHDSRVQLNLDELNTGLYMIRVENDEVSSITKFFKE